VDQIFILKSFESHCIKTLTKTSECWVCLTEMNINIWVYNISFNSGWVTQLQQQTWRY